MLQQYILGAITIAAAAPCAAEALDGRPIVGPTPVAIALVLLDLESIDDAAQDFAGWLS